MTGQPIATTYVEIRPAPGSKEQLKRDIVDAATPAGAAAGHAVGQGLSEGAKKGRQATEEQLTQLDARMLRTQAVAETIGKGVGRAAVRLAQLGGAGLALGGAAGLAQIRSSQAATAQLEASLKSTGNQAGLTKEQMLQLADGVQKYSGQSADSIVTAEAQLTAYKRVTDQVGAGNDIFTRATKSTADLAQRMGGDAAREAQILGRALNDPIHGLSALVTAGVDFDAQQVKTITRLEQTGQHLAAQKLILDQVEQTVGGAAAAYGKTLPGALDRAKNSFQDSAASVVQFGFEHKTLSGTLAGTAAALYVTVKAVKAYKEIRDTLFAGAARRIATNVAEAKSIDAIAAAEARAAAGAGAVGAGGAAAAAGRGGLLGVAAAGGGAIGLGAGAIGLGALAVGAAGIHSIGTVKTNQAVERLHDELEKAGANQRDLAQYELSLRDKLLGFDKDKLKAGQDLLRKLEEQQHYTFDTNALADATTQALRKNLATAQAQLAAAKQARKDPATLDRSAGVFGGAFDKLPDRLTGDPVAARKDVAAANKDVRDAQRALDAATGGGRGASRSQIASAEAGVASAEAALRKRGGDAAAEQARLAAAEARLSDLRAKGGANTDKVRAAEDRLTEARAKAKDAAKKLEDAEKPKALGGSDVLKRVTDQANNAKTLVADADLLIARGVSASTLTALQQVEKENPGSFDKLAKTITPAMAKSLNTQNAALQKAQFEFYDAPRVAALRSAEAAIKADKDGLYARIAKAQSDAYQRALHNNAIAGLTPPPPSSTPDKPSPGNQRGDGTDHRAQPAAPDAPAAGNQRGDGIDHRQHVSTKSTTINMPNAVIVANDTKALFDEMDKRARRDALR